MLLITSGMNDHMDIFKEKSVSRRVIGGETNINDGANTIDSQIYYGYRSKYL